MNTDTPYPNNDKELSEPLKSGYHLNKEFNTAAGSANENDKDSFLFSENIDCTTQRRYRDFAIHVFCLGGSARLLLGNKEFMFEESDCAVILNNSLLRWTEESDDLRVRCVLISNKYLATNSPDTNYSSMGMLSLMDDPLLRLDKNQFELLLAVVEAVRLRLNDTSHVFHEGVLRRAVETLVLDIYNLHSSHAALTAKGVGNQGQRIFRQFITLLEEGNFRHDREVLWYAKELKISAKYLSEVCLDVSGHNASHWINRFTTEEIARLLHNPTLPINSIADLLQFSTRSYFSHYVKVRLGMTPKDYRLSVLGVKK